MCVCPKSGRLRHSRQRSFLGGGGAVTTPELRPHSRGSGMRAHPSLRVSSQWDPGSAENSEAISYPWPCSTKCQEKQAPAGVRAGQVAGGLAAPGVGSKSQPTSRAPSDGSGAGIQDSSAWSRPVGPQGRPCSFSSPGRGQAGLPGPTAIRLASWARRPPPRWSATEFPVRPRA